MNAFLDGPLYFLERSRPGVLDPALLRTETGHAALLFTTPDGAGAHLSALPAETVVSRADDLREKEELLTAVLARGAGDLWLDAPPGGDPARTYPARRALEYVQSFKRQTACL